MGYRSEWQLLVAGTEEQVKEFESWMHDKQEESAEGPLARRTDIWDFIRSCRNEVEKFTSLTGDPMVGLSWSNDFTKCYPPWDNIIDQVFEWIEENDMDAAYGRMGENHEDVDIRDCNKQLYVSTIKYFEKPFENFQRLL